MSKKPPRLKPEPSMYPYWIRHKVEKHSGKPFKSGAMVATVVALGLHPITERAVFYFKEEEKGYFVECDQCRLWIEVQ